MEKNKGGRPFGSKTATPYRTALMMELASRGEDFKELRRIARANINKALEGDTQASREIADRTDGKPAQQMNINSTVDATVQVITGVPQPDAD